MPEPIAARKEPKRRAVPRQHTIRAAPEGRSEVTRVLKHNDLFAVLDAFGDLQPREGGGQGVYFDGTRFCSCIELRIASHRPLFLGSHITEDNLLLAVDLANPDIRDGDSLRIPAHTLHIFRSKFLRDRACYERVRIQNFSDAVVQTELTLSVAADFRDIFEVRGTKRKARGTLLQPTISPDGLTFGYTGLDHVTRRTRVACDPPPEIVDEHLLVFPLELPPGGTSSLHITVHCLVDSALEAATTDTYELAFHEAATELTARRERSTHLFTSNELFNNLLNRSAADLQMLTTDTPQGPYPYAGVPWFSTIFGRDGLVTALETLWLAPQIACGVLRYLAAHQAKGDDPENDAETGKILHEQRSGEMAGLREIPFGHYYGTIDSTLLFVMLAYRYYVRTGDRATLEEIWPAVQLAVDWLERTALRNPDGFITYARMSSKGLVHQGWKDSYDSISHSSGALAEPPIALCEVQAYAYAAQLAAAELALTFGPTDSVDRLRSKAKLLKQRFAERFWCPALGTYALAIDGSNEPCEVRSSNAGRCLFAGIAAREHVPHVVATLMSPAMFSGWGIRTLSSDERRYNPLSYHNGSVWPHDNALIASGLARYGYKNELVDLFTALFDGSLFVDLHRLPELYCGLGRQPDQGPTLYPVACSPQAWAAASPFLMLQACLGLEMDALAGEIRLAHPRLPRWLDWIEIRKLRMRETEVDLRIRRVEEDVLVEVLKKSGKHKLQITQSV